MIDLFPATPEPERAPALQLLEVRGPVQSQRPWVRYEYADPELQALASGQKMLLRVGLGRERRLRAKLAELRATVARANSPAH